MKKAFAAVGIVPLMAAIVSAAPQSAKADDVVVHATAYVVDFVKRFSSVVAEEQYVQESSTLPRVTGSGSDKSFDQPTPIRRVLKSDFLLIRRETNAEWNTFRDVFEVDGRPVRDRRERLTRLLARPTAEADQEARRIAFEGARYNLGGSGRTINNPLTVLALLQPRYQSRFRFTSGKPDKEFPSNVAVVEYQEQSRPTILRLKAGRDTPMVGRLWVESDTGRLVKTELVVLGNDRVTTTFQFDERFQIAVPIELRESFVVGRTAIEGRATYGQFRQFVVSTEETIK
jgi:hypothetical protein